MQAIVYHRYGSPDVLECQEIPIPVPAEDQVLVRVHAASVNPYDWHLLRGTPWFIRLFTGMSGPKTPRLGADVAGVVEAVGAGVASFKPGDAVFGTAKGAFAEFACAAGTELAVKPQALSFGQAACLPIAGITALQGLRDKGGLQAGQTVLIHGASGGVGTFAIQIAKWMGAHVTAVCSGRNIEMVRSLGADRAIDYTREDFARSGQVYDLLFDLVGNRRLPTAYALSGPTAPTSPAAAVGRNGVHWSCLRESWGTRCGRGLSARRCPLSLPGSTARIWRFLSQDLALLADLGRRGNVLPVLDRSYSLRETADAIRYVETGHARGKVAITVA